MPSRQQEKFPHAATCAAIVGITDEGAEIMKEYKASPALDAGLLAAAQAITHHYCRSSPPDSEEPIYPLLRPLRSIARTATSQAGQLSQYRRTTPQVEWRESTPVLTAEHNQAAIPDIHSMVP